MSPTSPDNLVCEHCFAETTATPTDDEALTDLSGDAYDIECSDCGYTGWVVVEAGEITTFDGIVFGDPEHSSYHHGWREEPNVMLREHYHFEHDDTVPVGGGDGPEMLKFTNDEIRAGFDPTVTYECSCQFSGDSKTELANHLLAVAHNRGEQALK